MSVFRSIIALATAACAIFVAYSFGHGVSNGHTEPFILSGVALVVTLVLVVLQVRIGRNRAAG